MADTASPPPTPLELLRRSLERDRLGHAYLFVGDDPAVLDDAARQLAAILVCESPVGRSPGGLPLKACGQCPACQRCRRRQHPDVSALRPESKSRQIGIDATRELIRFLGLRPSEARHKVAIVADAERMTSGAANAFLKTLEEPSPGSVIILLTTEPDRLLETILSRCLRLTFASGGTRLPEDVEEWVSGFAAAAAASGSGLLARYQLLERLLARLGEIRASETERQEAASPIHRYPDATADQKERWEDETKAAIEAEYRRRRSEFSLGLQWWLRDVCLIHSGADGDLMRFPGAVPSTRAVAGRLSRDAARANLDRWQRTQQVLFTNVQEALALEVGLIGLQLHPGE